MTYAEIKDLLSCGFTPEQINLLTTSGDLPSSPDPETGADPITATGSLESPAEVGEETHLPSPTEGEDNPPDPLEDIRQQLQQLQQENKQLREQIQTNNIRDRTVETITGPDASEILGEIIRPSFKKQGG